MESEDLPRFARPPLVEVAGAVQFVALPDFALREIVRVGEALDDYELRELRGRLAPLHEPEHASAPALESTGPAESGDESDRAQPRQRGVYSSWDERYVAQLQHDRIAVSERRVPALGGEEPSSANVWRALEEISERVRGALVDDGAEHGPARATLVELTYVNEIRPAEGVWQGHGELHRVLRTLSPTAGNPPWAKVERTTLAFAFPLYTEGAFRGRLHVSATPAYGSAGTPTFVLQLSARRLLDGAEPLRDAFEACRWEAVTAFTALTTSPMHLQWGRER